MFLRVEKYNGVLLTITSGAPEKKKADMAMIKEFVIEFLKTLFFSLTFTTLFLCLIFHNHLPQIYKDFVGSPEQISLATSLFIMIFIFLWLASVFAFLERGFVLSAVCEWQSERRIIYLPLSDEACEKLGIHNVQDYCDFLNHFLFRTPFGRTYKNMPLEKAVKKYKYWRIVEIPGNILQEINTRYYHTNDNTENIYFDYDKGVFQVCKMRS